MKAKSKNETDYIIHKYIIAPRKKTENVSKVEKQFDLFNIQCNLL